MVVTLKDEAFFVGFTPSSEDRGWYHVVPSDSVSTIRGALDHYWTLLPGTASAQLDMSRSESEVKLQAIGQHGLGYRLTPRDWRVGSSLRMQSLERVTAGQEHLNDLLIEIVNDSTFVIASGNSEGLFNLDASALLSDFTEVDSKIFDSSFSLYLGEIVQKADFSFFSGTGSVEFAQLKKFEPVVVEATAPRFSDDLSDLLNKAYAKAAFEEGGERMAASAARDALRFGMSHSLSAPTRASFAEDGLLTVVWERREKGIALLFAGDSEVGAVVRTDRRKFAPSEQFGITQPLPHGVSKAFEELNV